MTKRALTAAAVEKLKPPATGQADHFDGGYPGLALRVSAGGRKSWTLFYRAQGKQRRLGLGVYPGMGLADAREAWRTARAAVEAGRDPATEKAAAKRRQPDTVRAVGEQFIEKWHRPRNRTADEVARQLAIHVYPEIGDRDIQTITRRDIFDMLDAAEKRGAAVAVNRVLANTRRLFAWAVERGVIDTSPVTAVKPPAPETARDRVLTDVEVRAFWLACDDVGEPFGAMFRLLLLTGSRLDEVASAPWTEIDLPGAVWRLPGVRTKNRRANVVPLAPAAVDIIAGLPRTSRLLFPARFARVKDGIERPASGFSRAKARLDAAMVARLGDGATLPPWRIHDLRRTAATGMAAIGVPPHVVEHALNHVSGSRAGVAGIYNRHDYHRETRAAAEAWARHVLGLVAGRPTANVVPLAR